MNKSLVIKHYLSGWGNMTLYNHDGYINRNIYRHYKDRVTEDSELPEATCGAFAQLTGL